MPLVLAARSGEPAAFDRLYERHARVVHAVLLSRTDASVAEDLVQDVFLAAWRRLDGLRDPAAFGGWLLAIARHLAVDHARQARPHVDLPDDLSTTDPDRLEAARALDAIRALPEAYRETLLLRLVEGMTGPEIAARTGLTPDSVRVNLCRGMKLLRARLET